jgi:hypothetical protein
MRHVPNTRPITDLHPVINKSRTMNKPLAGRREALRPDASVVFRLKGILTPLQHGQDAETFFSICARATTATN